MRSNTFFKSFLKFTSFALPVAGFAFYGSNIYTSQKSSSYSTTPTDFFQKYIQEKNLVESSLYTEFAKRHSGDSFLETGIVKHIKGLDYLRVYHEKPFFDVFIRDTEHSHEERRKIEEQAKLYCFFVPNEGVQRQKGVVHSGLIFTLLDNMAGEVASIATGLEPIVTAYLNTEYFKPLEINKGYISILEVQKVENRKIFIKGSIINQDNEICAKMDSLFIKIQGDTLRKANIYKELINEREQAKLNEAKRD